MAQAVEEWYKQMPIITRSYLTAAVVTTVGCSLEVCTVHSRYLVRLFFLWVTEISLDGLSFWVD